MKTRSAKHLKYHVESGSVAMRYICAWRQNALKLYKRGSNGAGKTSSGEAAARVLDLIKQVAPSGKQGNPIPEIAAN